MKETDISLDDGLFSMEKSIEAINAYNSSLNSLKEGKFVQIT
jgi:hypothetical protein